MVRESKLIKDVLEIFGNDPRVYEVIKRREARVRKPAPPPPPGGICINAASRKYHIPVRTISRWGQQGKLNIKLRTDNEVYIDEEQFKPIAEAFHALSGRRTLRKALSIS